MVQTLNTLAKIRIFREGGTLAQEIKDLKRPSRGSARWEEKSRQYDTLISCHKEYSKQVQDFVDSVTLDDFRLWLRQVKGSEVEQAYFLCCPMYMLKKVARYRNSLRWRPSWGAQSTGTRASRAKSSTLRRMGPVRASSTA
jgi:hypothetical protein